MVEPGVWEFQDPAAAACAAPEIPAAAGEQITSSLLRVVVIL